MTETNVAQEFIDRLEIQAALTRYATGVDTKNWELWQSVFTEDAEIDYSDTSPVLRGTPARIAAMLGASFAKSPWTMHYVSNIDIAFEGSDAAKVTAMFFNPCRLPGQDENSYFGGYYHHDFVRTADGWKSVHLVEKMIWWHNFPGGAPASAATS
ncbi:MAG TPA: nuclear transport factor 2 family protein [Jatrophihabitans sp.]|jgi:3-phenylpropionate/cinnamic acid dioxygenase small subunit